MGVMQMELSRAKQRVAERIDDATTKGPTEAGASRARAREREHTQDERSALPACRCHELRAQTRAFSSVYIISYFQSGIFHWST